MSDLFEDAKHNCSFNKTEIDTLKRRFEEVVERTSIREPEGPDFNQTPSKLSFQIPSN
jgi:hypothetical protein